MFNTSFTHEANPCCPQSCGECSPARSPHICLFTRGAERACLPEFSQRKSHKVSAGYFELGLQPPGSDDSDARWGPSAHGGPCPKRGQERSDPADTHSV